MLIDTHCHLNDEKYTDLETLVLEMKQAGVSNAICVGYDLTSSQRAKEIADRFDEVYFTAGVHPDSAKEYPFVEKDVKNLLTFDKCLAVGEIGLDYHYDGYDKNAQMEAFEKQIAVANEFSLPISVHTRDALNDTLFLLKSNINKLQNRGVMHCYSGSKESAKLFLDMGFYISFSGTLTFKNASNLKEVAKYLPLDRVLVETDCPYLAPQKVRGQINYPKYVRLVAEELCALRQLKMDELEEILKNNAKNLFTKLKNL